MPRPSWPAYFMALARQAAARSTCPRAPNGGVGCVLVDASNRILATGYVGSLRSLPHCSDVGCLLGPDGGCIRTVHAEANAVLHALGSLDGATAYCTLSPCLVCAKLLLQAGVKNCYYADTYRLGVEQQLDFARQLGAGFYRLDVADASFKEGFPSASIPRPDGHS
jgi:dCMP deaminase